MFINTTFKPPPCGGIDSTTAVGITKHNKIQHRDDKTITAFIFKLISQLKREFGPCEYIITGISIVVYCGVPRSPCLSKTGLMYGPFFKKKIFVGSC